MSKFKFFRQWISFLKKARVWVDMLGVLLSIFVFIYYAPPEILNANPATGGDTGSHFWPLITLVREGLPNLQIRVWNPGNLGGEPHLTHYFPLPYLVMAFLSLVMPLGRAFNIGTFLPLILMPLCIYFCFRGFRTRFPIPVLATVFGISFLYNESFSMWGGNALSTLAGQFAHLYALCFFLLGIGCLAWEMGRRQFPWVSTFLFAAVLLSHFYVALYLPIVFLCFLFFERTESFQIRLRKLFFSGLLSLALSFWFVGPMLHNAKWNTAFGLKWSGAQLFNEAFPVLFWPFILMTGLYLILYLCLSIFGKPQVERENRLVLPLLSSLILISVFFYFVFPPMGLVDVRIFPVLQMTICFFAALGMGLVLSRHLPSVWVVFLAVPISIIGIWWGTQQIYHFPYWLKWNYSGWEAKPAYTDLLEISEDLRGDFSEPRVIYENSELSNSAGTMRVFEMLPYFAQRSTLESVYMQATILAPAAFYLQALISKTPSCPFPNYQCTNLNISKLERYLPLMGVSQLILVSKEAQSQAEKSPFLEKQGDYGLWHLYQSNRPAPLVQVLDRNPKIISETDFKDRFYKWFINWTGDEEFLLVGDKELEAKIKGSIFPGVKCDPKLEVDFNEMKLTTDCPGKFHFLKFAFHSTWKASSGDELFLLSPGFIGIIPSQKNITLRWGQHWFWGFSNAISWLCFLGAIIYGLSRLRRNK